jgi:capsular exopolysaccharide synthesis family protein
MELSDLRLALRKYWWLSTLVFLGCLGLGFMAAYGPEKTYRTTATVTLDPQATLDYSPDYVLFRIPAVLELIQSDAFLERVSAEVPEEHRDAAVDISASSPDNTPIIRVSAEGHEPAALAAWATAAGNEIVDELAPTGANDETYLPLQLIDAASVPNAAVAPNTRVILVASAMLGLLGGFLGAIVLHRVRRALNVPEELQRRLGVSVIGTIPMVPSLRRQTQTLPVLAGGASELTEAFQAIRTNMEMMALEDAPGALAVTSWDAGEGKSTVTAGIALSLAGAGRSVLAIDADLRHPQLHNRFGQPFGPGLAEFGHLPADALVVPSMVPSLSLLAAGTPSRHPAEILAAALPQVLELAAAHGQIAVIDAPPLNGVAETPVILAAAGHVVLVADARSPKLFELEQVVGRLRVAGVRVVGVVLNRARRVRRPAYTPHTAYRSPGEPPPARRGGRPAPARPARRTAPTRTGR